MSLKLSALVHGLDKALAKGPEGESKRREIAEGLSGILQDAAHAPGKNIFLRIDMEEYAFKDLTLDIFRQTVENNLFPCSRPRRRPSPGRGHPGLFARFGPSTCGSSSTGDAPETWRCRSGWSRGHTWTTKGPWPQNAGGPARYGITSRPRMPTTRP